MTPEQRLRIADVVKLRGESLAWKMDMINSIVEEIEDKAFNAGRDSAPQFPGTEDVLNRLDALETAIGELYPGWRTGGHAPSCRCGSCDIGF